MDPKIDSLEAEFNQNIEQWISKQGLLFQIRHSKGLGSLFPHLFGLLVRLVILFLIGVIVFWFYLTSRLGSEAFKEDVQDQLAHGMNAGEVEISSINREKGGILSGEMVMSSLSMGETDLSFFEDWVVKEETVSVVGRRSVVERKNSATFEGVRLLPLGIGDNYFSGVGWSFKALNILKGELKLKTGAASDELALASYASLFKEYESFNLSTIEIYDTTIHWGHSESSAGVIRGAQLNISRKGEDWEILVTGGSFSHGWLKEASISEMKILCKKAGEVVIESALFTIGEGEMKLSARILVGAKPEVAGTYSFRGVKVLDLVGEGYDKWLGGEIDGKGVISGNMNTAGGIKLVTTVPLMGNPKRRGGFDSFGPSDTSAPVGNESILVVRGDAFPLLKLFQMKDPRNSYALLRAHKGELVIESVGRDTRVKVNDLRCGINDLIFLRGEFDYSVKREVVGTGKDDEEAEGEELSYDLAKVFSGKLKLGVISEAFENNLELLKTYPVDDSTLRVWFDVDMEGEIEELTEVLADKLYGVMTKGENNE